MTLTPQDRFEIGGEELLGFTNAEALDGAARQEAATARQKRDPLDDIRVRVGTLLKAETVSFLLGAGAAVDCGGLLIGSVPVALERDLQQRGIQHDASQKPQQWLTTFYLAARVAGASNSPTTPDEVIERQKTLEQSSPKPLQANFEKVLDTLYRWRSALHGSVGRLRIDGSPSIEVTAGELDEAIEQATHALARACSLPLAGKESGLSAYKTFVRKALTRPLNLKRVNIFTLNYDTLVEQAADAEGVVLLDGFVGTQRRIFRPESYEHDLYFPAETTEGRVHRFDRVLHLYKLHGSITWSATEPTVDDPYGVQSAAFTLEGTKALLIYPTPAKYDSTLGMPYSELFRRFSAALVRPQSVLFVIGYGFGDKHVNAIIRQALAVPSFTLAIVDPKPTSDFVRRLRDQRDRRVWIVEGPTVGTFTGFVEHILPDLRDEEIRRKVLATYRALTPNGAGAGDAADGD